MTDEQAYYWSDAWQQDEQETLDALAEGKGLEFSNADALIQWLCGE